MTNTAQITVAENVYRGGTVVAPEGSVITPEMAYTLGVGDDGKVDHSLSTDELLRRAQETSVRIDEGAGTVDTDTTLDATDQLTDATAADVVAYLQANPAEVDSVDAAEQGREKGPRVTVLDAIDRIRSGGS